MTGWRVWWLLTWLVGVGCITLFPDKSQALEVGGMPGPCLICGSRGLADAILNVILFVPLGFALGGSKGAVFRATVAAAVISSIVETGQIFVPGRHATPSDVLWNSVGGAFGTSMCRIVASAVWERRGRWALAWSGTLVAAFVAAGVLMTPWRTERDYWVEWTSDFGDMEEYGGRVLWADLNDRPFPPGQIDHEGPDGELLDGEWVVEAGFIVANPPSAISPILSVSDNQRHEILLVGAVRTSLVFRESTVARRLRMDAPDVRVPHAFAGMSAGDTTVVVASRSAGRTCLALGDRLWCGLGVTPGRTWGVLLYSEEAREGLRVAADLSWLAVLFAPLGLLGRRREVMLASALALLGLTSAVFLTPMIAPPSGQLVACLAGIGGGRLARLVVRASARGT